LIVSKHVMQNCGASPPAKEGCPALAGRGGTVNRMFIPPPPPVAGTPPILGGEAPRLFLYDSVAAKLFTEKRHDFVGKFLFIFWVR